ncbi:recombinase family protein [Aeromonas veronii]|uniref:recombinase family protein n=1 Tax=Aeromonas veronii TaxID=654 RepID=UPI003D24C7B0
MAIAILYSRFSSSQQADGDSLRRQTERAQQFCLQNGLTLSDITFQDLGISGWQAKKRDGLESLIEAIESGSIPAGSFVLVEAADRLSRRGFRHVLQLVERLVSTKCKFVTVENGQIYDERNIDSLASALPLMISADLAKQESDRKSERLRAVKTNKRKQRVIQGRQPFWIDVVDGEPKFNKHKDLARRIVDLRLQGKAAATIAKMFNEEGIEAIRGKHWYAAPIRRICESTTLYGAKTYFESRDGEVKPVETVSGLYPAICTYEEFQRITTQNKQTGRKQAGPFNGLLKCSCGRSLVIKQIRGGSTYRVCTGKVVGICDQGGYFRDTDPILLNVLRDLKVARMTGGIVGEVDDTEIRIQNLEQQLKDLQEMRIANRGKPAVLQMLLEDIHATSEELADLKNKPKQIISDVDLLAIVNVSDPDEQNSLLRGCIARIECTKPTSVTARYRVHFKNGFVTSCQTTHSRKDGLSVMMLGNGQATFDADAINELQPWELDQE